MPDRRPDPDEVGDAASTSGPRRSGLDRLRAARGGAGGVGSGTAAADGTDSDGRDRSGPTAVLDPSKERTAERAGTTVVDRSTDTTAEPATEAEGETRRHRHRRGTASADESAAAARKGRAVPVSGADRPASTRQLVVALVLVALIIGLLVPVVLMRHRVFGESKEQRQITDLVEKRTEALSMARRFAATFFTTDYKTIDQYSDQVAAMSTGGFQKDFNDKRAQLKSLLTQVQTEATGNVLSAGVSKVSGNDAEVLLIVDQQAKNATTKGKTTTTRYRVKVSLQKTPKGWLVTDLEPVT